tara:strand:- start:724 stop:933 length:210 start_codon:yes stop_codon:yes gene_type:complete
MREKWTDERVQKLKQLRLEGKTAYEIASELGDVSRNAVIGKIHRLGLSSPGNKKSSRPVTMPTYSFHKK